ncbi:class I tRNA ligase family protein [Micromonospora sp. BRA006-A]|nr:class I tRNA ligase family protein [Micromonospora sp. BRA006-A]
MDHAGIATQNLVERQLSVRAVPARPRAGEVRRAGLAMEGRVRRRDPRPDAPARRRRRLGPWKRFTMDEGLSRAADHVQKLFDDGLIYRANRIINWCPRLTALSDIEVEHTDDEGELVSIRYGDEVVVATTRAETMLGDTAVACTRTTSATGT